MNTRRSRSVILFGILAFLSLTHPTSGAQSENDVTAEAKRWLSLVDDQKYVESWDQASSMFRSQVNQDQWIAALKRSREPLGTIVSRVRTRIQFTKALRGAPDGNYAILHFETSFSKKNATERLTLILQDGEWQVVAYGIY